MSYPELGPIAAALGVAANGQREIQLSRDGLTLVIELDINSGSVSGVSLLVLNRGWPEVEFRREKEGDRAAKRSGMNVEVQTNDRPFDDAIYIESDFGQATLGPLLTSPIVRRGIEKLVAEHGKVTITKRALKVGTQSLGLKMLEPTLFLPYLEEVMALAMALPRVGTDGPRIPDRGSGLLTLAVLGMLLGLFSPACVHHTYPPLSGALRMTGFAIGFVTALVAIPFVRERVRGHSRSAFYFRAISGLAILGLAPGVMSAIVLVNGAFDPSAPQPLTGRIVEARPYETDDASGVTVAVAWDDGSANTYDLKNTSAKVGDPVRAVRRRGALRFAWWQDEPALAPK